MIILLKRAVRSGWINFYRNLGLSLVAVFVIAATLILAVSIFAARDFGNMVISNVRDKMSISLYFKEGVDEETVLGIKEELQGLEQTQSIDYTSKSEALEIFIERYKDNPILMASLAEVGNPFLPSLRIKAGSPEDYEFVAAYLHDSPSLIFFEKIDFDQRKEFIQQVFFIISTVQKIGIGLAAVLGIVAILIVFNTVLLSIYGMKDEIKIMSLVGVSGRFIRGSFVFQGAIVGIASFLLAFLTVFGFGIFFGERIDNLVPGLDIFFYLKSNFLFILLAQLGLGMGLGTISSLIATERHLKT